MPGNRINQKFFFAKPLAASFNIFTRFIEKFDSWKNVEYDAGIIRDMKGR